MMKLDIQMFASTNKTANYELPQFVGTDKPTWLGDFNTAMATIDAGMAKNKSDIESMDSRVSSAESTASTASQNVATLTGRVNTLQTNVESATTTANNAQSTATSALTTANSAQSTANTADSKADTNASSITALAGRVSAIEEGEDYSSTEVNTGKKWIDNKDVYRAYLSHKVNTSQDNVDISHNLNIDHLIHVDAICTISGQTPATFGYRPMPQVLAGTSYEFAINNIKANTIAYTCKGWDNNHSYIVLEYTKNE